LISTRMLFKLVGWRKEPARPLLWVFVPSPYMMISIFVGVFKCLESTCSNEAETPVCSGIVDLRFGVPLIYRNLSAFT
jgi:hypothetical protein